MTMFTESERRAFARHEQEQRRIEAALPIEMRLAMLADMQESARLFGHGAPPPWAAELIARDQTRPKP